MSKITRFFGGAVFAAVLLLGAGTLPVQASSGLTNTQIQAILSVLSSFGASSATIANVNAALGGTTTTSTAPAITQIHWAAGVMDVASTTISIRGTNLQGATKVNFYNATGQLVQSAVVQYAANAGPNSLVIFSSSPGNSFIANLTGTYQVRVVTPSGTSNALPYNFSATPTSAPTITRINWTAGVMNVASTSISISGTNLANATEVDFYNASNQLMWSVPTHRSTSYAVTILSSDPSGSFIPDAIGTYQVRVVTPSGTSNALSFTFPASTATPTITQIGWAAGVMNMASSSIAIRGTNLTGATRVDFYNASNQLVQSAVVQYAANAGPNSLVIFSSSPGNSFIANLTGTYQVRVVTPSGTSNALPFTFPTTSVAPTTTATLTASQATIAYGARTTIYWTSSNATSCSISPAITIGEGSSLNGNGSTGSLYRNTTYTLTCTSSGGSVSKSVTVTVNPPLGPASALSAVEELAQNNSTSPFTYVWNNDLQIGSPYTSDISALQTALTKEGVYSGEITGGFYTQTYLAVKAFQQKYGIKTSGYVGAITRSKLNELY